RLDGLDEALIGTSEHGALGTRWIYDAAYDPVAVTQLLDFLCGGCEAQSQSVSDTPDPSVGRSWTSGGRPTVVSPLLISDGGPGRTTVAVEVDGSSRSLELIRVPSAALPGEEVLGSVEAGWTGPDGTSVRGTVVVVR
ncbi:MAG TPA: 1,4-alpha-glucan branching protein, partial [Blastococcus sp.]|nr:1,4-alpha-glucan branching protein [Blastococcus sp.]